MSEDFIELKKKLSEIYNLASASAVLSWDLETYMPPKASGPRGDVLALLGGLIHEKFTSPEFGKMLEKFSAEADAGNLDPDETVIVNELARDFERAVRLPKEFVEEMARLESSSHHVWVEARKKNDFSFFAPNLAKIYDMKRKEAEYLGYKDSPYDALLDGFEKDLTCSDLEPVFNELKEFLGPFIKKILESKTLIDPSILKGKFNRDKQNEFGTEIVKKMGFDLEAGRVDESAHPFTIGLHPGDTRITTSFKEDDLFHSLHAFIHEAGHALYDQGLDRNHFGTPLGEARSLGIHESQSRMWENQIGKSAEFWKYWYPRLQEIFPQPFSNISFEDFYKALNAVKPTAIRINADEVTYNLHIVVRYEIEKALLEGTLEVRDLPKVWNEKIKNYLGLDIEDDANGVLQDVHWSQGFIGYFPTYALGNLYAAQFFRAAKKDILNLDSEIEKGEYGHLLEWLRKNIHIHGKRYAQDELVMRATGEKLTPSHFINYIKDKFGKIYGLAA